MPIQRVPGEVPKGPPSPGDFPREMSAVLAENPFKKEVQTVLEGNTELGRFVKPLVDSLKALPPERQAESLESFSLIYEFFKTKEVDYSGFTREDALFMLTDPVGELIRRPSVYLHFAKRLGESIKVSAGSESETAIKELYIKRFSSQAWSKFVGNQARRGVGEQVVAAYPGEGIQVDDEELISQWMGKVHQDPGFCFRMVQLSSEIAHEFDEKYTLPLMPDYTRHCESKVSRAGMPPRGVFITDPPHAFGLSATTYQDSILVSMELGNVIKLPPLAREASFMLVEDNPAHRQWTVLLANVGNLSMYEPSRRLKPPDEYESGYGEGGEYKTAEFALKAINDRVSHDGRPPDVILSDIELGSGMNGIEFVKKVKREHPDVIILMLWTSNPLRYSLQVKELIDSGVISASFNKLDFDPRGFIDAVNNVLEKRK